MGSASELCKRGGLLPAGARGGGGVARAWGLPALWQSQEVCPEAAAELSSDCELLGVRGELGGDPYGDMFPALGPPSHGRV